MSAERIIRKFGSARALAKAISFEAGREIHRTTVTRWLKPRKLGGTTGHIPYKFHQYIWCAAKRLDIDLKKEDFLTIED